MIGVASGYSSSMVTTLNRSYTDAIYRAGGIPVILPQVNNAAEASEILSHLDGLLLSGGEDMAPAYYGESVLNETVSVNAHRDTIDVLYAEAALLENKPILAICRGEQLMNITLGASLYQDLPTQIGTEVSHGGTRHPITLTHDGTLYKIFGKDTLNVNSFHHQAVKVQAPGIRIMANAPDGIVEGYETDQVLAVQFHPEQLVQKDSNWLAFFRYFIGRLQ